jgi:tRNA(Ile)-lysidine synthetase-like protein
MKTSGAEPKLEQARGQAPSRKIPRQMGGTLIRRVIAHLRSADIRLPLTPSTDSHILIACSGGVDSTALAVLIAKYGNKIAQGVSILHVNHGWRGRQSDLDAQFVESLARKLGVPCVTEKLDPADKPVGRSWEEWGRIERKRLYERHAGPDGIVLTGHQADELCETLVWRLFTGSVETHGKGILVRQGKEIRPLLSSFKEELEAFLKEEGLSWRRDPSNTDPQFLRAAFRTRLEPMLSQQFPRWKEHLLRYASSSRQALRKDSPAQSWIAEWFGAAGVRMKRVHWSTIREWISRIQKTTAARPAPRDRVLESMDLEDGWRVGLELQEGSRSPRIILSRK